MSGAHLYFEFGIAFFVRSCIAVIWGNGGVGGILPGRDNTLMTEMSTLFKLETEHSPATLQKVRVGVDVRSCRGTVLVVDRRDALSRCDSNSGSVGMTRPDLYG